MPPNFSLQPVLDYRETIVETLEIELGQLIREKTKTEKTIRKLSDQERNLWAEMITQQVGEMNLIRIEQLQQHLDQLEKQKELLMDKLKEIVAAIHKKRQEIITAKQDQEVLEIIKEKEEEEYQELVKQNNLKLQDDIYIAQAYQSRI